MTQFADRVFKNAKVYSVGLDGTETRAEAVAVKDGKFIFVGSDAEAEKYIGENTVVTDCNGKSIIPGLGDAHLHNAQASMKYGTCDLGSIVPDNEKDTPEGVIKQIQEKVKAFAEAHPDDPVIKGLGWDRFWFSGNLQGIVRPFTRRDIDAVVPDRPVVLTSYCGHVVLMNTKAMEIAGVMDESDDHNGMMVREADGSFSGFIQEPAVFGPFIARIPDYNFTAKQNHDCIAESFAVLASRGYTLVCDCQQVEPAYEVLSEMAKNGEFTARVTGVHNINDATREDDLAKAVANRTKFDVEDLFIVDTVKYFADGTPSMLEPYTDAALAALGREPGYRDPLLWDEDHMKESMAQAQKEGFNINTHAFGSYTMRRLIDCYENAQKLYPNPRIRNLISHCAFVKDEDKARMGENHIIASIQPGWFSIQPVVDPVNVTLYGEETVKHAFPSKSFIDNGVICAYGSDYPVNVAYGLDGIQVAITRKYVRCDVNYEKCIDLPAAMPAECVTLKEALQAHTINVAYQAHLEDVTGSIEVGKSAELVLLDSDIENIPAEQIQDIKVLETVFRGKTVFKMKADRVFRNAKVYSVALDGTETRAEAVAVKDGKFIFVGSDAEAEKYIGENTVVTDCCGDSVLPGFGDAHMHFSISVRRFGVIDLNDLVTDYDSQKPDDIVKIIQERVKAFADSHPDDEVLHGSGWERAWFEGNLGGIMRLMTRHDIDAVVADRPVTLDSSCGHRCLLNTKALEMAGLMGGTSDPLGDMIQREPDGTPTGMIHETSAIVDVCGRIPGFEYSDRQYRQAMLDSQDFFASRGFTYLCDCLRTDGPYRVLKKMAEDGELKVRVDGVFNCKDATWEEDIDRAISEKGAFDVDDLFKVDTVKYFMDENIAMVEPYPDDYCDALGMPHGSGTKEALLWDVGNYRESMEKAKKAGYNIHVHSYGDLATRETIDSMINAQKHDPEHKLRDIIAHIFFIHKDDPKRMADAGIIASIQPQWESANIKDCGPLQAMVGEERFAGMYPNGSLARAGVCCANGSDFTVTMTNALEGISVAMTRKYPKNHKYYETYKDAPVLNPSEAATLKDSIMGWTINVAYQFGRENITGSIEVGKSAELVVLNGDIENTPAEDICLLQVKETVFKGQTTYKAQ